MGVDLQQGWSPNRLVSVAHRTLRASLEQPGSTAAMIGDQLGVDVDDVALVMQWLAGQGWGKLWQPVTPKGTSLSPTPSARVTVAEWDSQSRTTRHRACTAAVLSWAADAAPSEAEHSSLRQLSADHRRWYYGMPFSNEETEAAADLLKEQGMIEGHHMLAGPYVRMWVTSSGHECVDEYDGDVRAWQRARYGGTAGSVTVTAAQVMWGSPGAVQTQTGAVTVTHGAELDEVGGLLRNLQELLAMMPPTPTTNGVVAAVRELDDEIQGPARPVPLRHLLAILRSRTIQWGAVATTAAAAESGKQLVGQAPEAIDGVQGLVQKVSAVLGPWLGS